MGYRIKKNIFAPKLKYLAEEPDWPHSHAISYNRCDFRCAFCAMDKRSPQIFHDYDAWEFELVVQVLMRDGNRFKFTGGEPTLNPNLARDLRIVKNSGGFTFLDTNGSQPQVVKSLLDEGLVDVLALSLKGLTPQEALATAGINNRRLCWDNLFQSLSIANEHTEVETLLTLVLDSTSDVFGCLERFHDLARPYPHIRLKVNNLNVNSATHINGMQPLDSDALHEQLELFVERHPEHKDRLVYIPNKRAIYEFEYIGFI